MKVHIVWCHPRQDSLTHHVVDLITKQLINSTIEVDVLDLYRENFNPVLETEDEPDWNNADKSYSPEVHKYSERALNSEAIVFVFPVWWYGLPAILKGYLDRVWNQGLLYGRYRPQTIKSVTWVALTGLPQSSFERRGYHSAMKTLLNRGIAKYCEINFSEVVFLYDTIDKGLTHKSLHDLEIGIGRIQKNYA